jgi:hypothetical protein
MKKIKFWLTGLFMLGVAAYFSIPAAVSADEIDCAGTIGAITVDNIAVPQGVTCILDGTIVQGTVTVGRNATLQANGVRVVGNIQGENSRSVVVRRGSQVGGSVTVVQSRSAAVLASRVTGDIHFDANTRYLRVNGNRVGGNVEVVANTGGAEVFRNVIDGNLQCKENAPAPTGGSNTVGGVKENQCATF